MKYSDIAYRLDKAGFANYSIDYVQGVVIICVEGKGCQGMTKRDLELQSLSIEVGKAKSELAQAEQNLNYALEEDYKQIALDEYFVKRRKLDILLGRAKRLYGKEAV